MAALVLAATATATATAREVQHVRLTVAGQAAARSATIRKADLGSGGKWAKVASGSDSGSSSSLCPGFHPKDSDLVTNGHAEASYAASGIQIGTTTDVYATPQMSLLIWQRMVQSPKLLGCLGAAFLKGAVDAARKDGNALPKLVSARKIPYPRLGARTAAFHFLMDVPTSQGHVGVMGDMVFIAHGRSHLLLIVAAPNVVATYMTTAEGRLGRILVGRMRA